MLQDVFNWLAEQDQNMEYGAIKLEIRKHQGEIVAIIKETKVENHYKIIKKTK